MLEGLRESSTTIGATARKISEAERALTVKVGATAKNELGSIAPVSSGSGNIGELLDRYRDGFSDSDGSAPEDSEREPSPGTRPESPNGGTGLLPGIGGLRPRVAPDCPDAGNAEPDSDAATGPIRGAIDRAAELAINSIVAGARERIDAELSNVKGAALDRLADAEKECRKTLALVATLVAFWGAVFAGVWYWTIRGAVRLIGILTGILRRIKIEDA